MANFLQVENLTKSFGDRLLFADINFSVEEGDKIGIVAKNGTGKSTLLKIIAGKETPDSGSVTFKNNIKTGYLEQLPHFKPGETITEAVLSGSSEVLTAINNYNRAVESSDIQAINAATHAMDALQGWDYQDRMNQLLTQFGISDYNITVDKLSGGQKKRVALAKVIIEKPDLLILDEPTNHLDIDIIEWLEQYLSRQRITLLLVTHDRYFLDRICSKILELHRTEAFMHLGDFNNYLRRRQERISALENQVDKVKNLLRKEQDWMSRQPQARAGKAKFRIDNYYHLKELSQLNYKESDIELNVKSSYIGSKIAVAHSISKRFDHKIILDKFTYTFSRYEKIGMVGKNGVGKSTFIKLMLGLMKPDSGEWEIGETVKFGYYSQDGIHFDKNKKIIDAVTEIADDIMLSDGNRFTPMQFLKKFLFEPADQQKYISTLSGGELCRLHLATVLMRSPNFLVLDEPTNDLDLVTLGLLADYLSEFKGCVLVISHDRHFLDQIADHLFVMEGDGKIKDFPGSYTEYHDWLAKNAKQSTAASLPANEPKASKQKSEGTVKMTFKERKEFEQLTEEIESLSTEKNMLESKFSSGENIENISELSARYNDISALLDEKELRWLELSEKG